MASPRQRGFVVDPIVLTHWRFKDAGLAGTGLWLLAATWCAEHMTDGHIPIAAVKALMPGAAAAAPRVLKSGLWSSCGEHEACVELRAFMVDGEGRPRRQSRESIEEKRRQERERKAAVRAVSARRPGAVRPDTTRTQAGQSPDTDSFDTTSSLEVPPLSPPQGTTPSAPTTASPRARLLPDSWSPAEKQVAYAAQHRLDLDAEVDKFRGHHGLRGTLGKDWDAGFRVWLRKAVEFRDERAARTPAPAAAPVRQSRKVD